MGTTRESPLNLGHSFRFCGRFKDKLKPSSTSWVLRGAPIRVVLRKLVVRGLMRLFADFTEKGAMGHGPAVFKGHPAKDSGNEKLPHPIFYMVEWRHSRDKVPHMAAWGMGWHG